MDRNINLKTALKHLQPLLLGVFFVSLPIILYLVSPFFDAVNDSGVWGRRFIQWVPIHLAIVSLVVILVIQLRNKTFELAPQLSFKSHRTSNLIAISVLLVVIAVMLWPISKWNSNLFGGTGDSYNWRWQLWRFGQELKNWHLFPTRFNDVVVPDGVDLRLNDGYLGMYIGGFWNLLFGATLAYNFTIATAISLNYWFARKISLLISDSNLIAILAGIASATAPCIAIRYPGHVNLAFSFVLFPIAAEALRLFSNQQPRRIAPSFYLLLAFLSSFYFFILGSFIYFTAAFIRLTRSAEKRARVNTVLRFVCIGFIVGIAVSPFIFARLKHDSLEAKAGAPSVSARTDEYMYYSADPRTFYIPSFDAHLSPQYATTIRSQLSPNTVENTPFPGYLFLAAITLGIAYLKPWRWFIAGFWTLFSILALGPTLTYGPDPRISGFFPRALVDDAQRKAVPWLLYSDFTGLPGFTSLRTPNRFSFALPVIGTVALAMLAKKYKEQIFNKKIFFSLLGASALCLLPNWRSSNYWFDTSYSSSINSALMQIRADQTNSAVIVAGDNCLLTIGLDNLQIVHRHPMIGCQTFSAAMPWYSKLQKYKSNRGLASIQCDSTYFGMVPTNFKQSVSPTLSTLTELRTDLNVSYVVVDKKHLCTGNMARAEEIKKTLDVNAQLIGDDSTYAIYKLR